MSIFTAKDPKCPAGYRFLLNLPDAKLETDAEREVYLMFGFDALFASRVVPGSDKANSRHDAYKFTPQKSGFTVYVPLSFRL